MKFRKRSHKPVRQYRMDVSGVEVEVVRKDIKSLRLTVYPPDGQVRVSVPLRMGDEAVRSVVIDRLEWIRKHQHRFQQHEHPPEPELVTGENIYFGGRAYRLNLIERHGALSVRLTDDHVLEMRIRPGSTKAQRFAVLDSWYRRQLSEQVPALIAKWEPVIGVNVAEWRIRKMKSRWGTCNVRDRRIWLNLELARRSTACLEFILVHEMVHLLERNHNARFRGLMDKFMPEWRIHEAELDRVRLG